MMRRDPYVESSANMRNFTLVRNVPIYNKYIYIICTFIHKIRFCGELTAAFVWWEIFSLSPAATPYIYICVCGTYQLGRFLPENPIVLPDIWLMSRDLQKRPAAYLCVAEREKQSVGAVRRFSMVFNVCAVCGYKERIETQLRAHCTHTHTQYYAGELLRIRN